MNPIVVTGAGGQLGSELCRQLGSQAVGLDLPEFDLADHEGVAAKLAQLQPQVVINTAAYTNVDKAEQDAVRCRTVNAEGVAQLAESCRRLDAVLVQLSTDYVFGSDPHRSLPYSESDPPAPQGVYARSKLEGESHAARVPKHFIIRTCGLYGPAGPTSSGNFVEAILRLARQGEPLRVVNDQQCTPSYTQHVARAIRFLLSTHAYGLYHVVNRGEATWFDVAAEILFRCALDVPLEPITTAEYGLPAPRPRYSVLNTAKYHALPGRPTMPRWQDALAQYLVIRGSHQVSP